MMSERQPLLELGSPIANLTPKFKFAFYYYYWVAVITDWQWPIAAYIASGVSAGCDNATSRSGNAVPKFLSCIQWFYVCSRWLIAMMGLFVQPIICLRRDRLDKNYFHNYNLLENNASKLVECHEASQLFSAIFVADVIILLLLFWVTWRRLGMCNTDNKNLNKLVNDIADSKPDIYTSVLIPTIPVIYVIYSQVVSFINLCAFHIVDSNVAIKWPPHTVISGSLKTTFILLSFFGFIAFDLLYTQLMIRYAFHCRMIIYFLEKIKKKVNDKTYSDQEQAIKDIKKARDFFEQLNDNSIVIWLAILITGFQGINSIINLLGNNNDYFQTIALAGRMIQWIFLTLFPVFQAAQVNAAVKSLCKADVCMHTKLVVFDEHQDEWIRKHAVSPITLEATLFGLTVKPLFPYVIVSLILFTLMLGSDFKWYEHLF